MLTQRQCVWIQTRTLFIIKGMIQWENIYNRFLESRGDKEKVTGTQYHKHHVIPRYLNRSKDNKKTVSLTVSDHATAHWILYKIYGNIQDKYAWCMLSGKTDESEYYRKLLNRQTPESIDKMLKTRRANNIWKPNYGSKNGMSVLQEKEVLEIYELIKKHYSDIEIVEKLELKVGWGAVHAVRSGDTWTHLWHRHFTHYIPSFFKNGPNGIPGRVKLRIFEWLDKGYTVEQISRHLGVWKYDIKRAQKGHIWKKVKQYYDTYKTL